MADNSSDAIQALIGIIDKNYIVLKMHILEKRVYATEAEKEKSGKIMKAILTVMICGQRFENVIEIVVKTSGLKFYVTHDEKKRSVHAGYYLSALFCTLYPTLSHLGIEQNAVVIQPQLHFEPDADNKRYYHMVGSHLFYERDAEKLHFLNQFIEEQTHRLKTMKDE